jgi:hypothetical protein
MTAKTVLDKHADGWQLLLLVGVNAYPVGPAWGEIGTAQSYKKFLDDGLRSIGVQLKGDDPPAPEETNQTPQATPLMWESVADSMDRSPIPGGWIVRQYEQRYNEGLERWDWMLVSAFFVPDAQHAWMPQGGPNRKEITR